MARRPLLPARLLTPRLLVNATLAKMERSRRRPERRALVAALAGREVLEIGGPSELFSSRGLIPVYPVVKSIDVVNFAATTIWDEQALGVPVAMRHTLLGEATQLSVADHSYDALLASHVLEHVANPLAALSEWQRVLRPDSPALVVLPHRDMTFDRRRPITPLEHLEDDERLGRGEDDLSHVPEVLALHDRRYDFFPGSPQAFEERCWNNAAVRGMHHHVFDTRSAVALLVRGGFDVESVLVMRPYHVAMLCRRGADVRPARLCEGALDAALRSSPFPSDQR